MDRIYHVLIINYTLLIAGTSGITYSLLRQTYILAKYYERNMSDMLGAMVCFLFFD